MTRMAVYRIFYGVCNNSFFVNLKKDLTVLFQPVDKIQVLFLRRLRRICVFSLTRAAKKHIVSEKPLIQRFFKGAGVALAGIECSPKIFDFRANGIPVGERVDFFDTLKRGPYGPLFYVQKYLLLFAEREVEGAAAGRAV